jgi:hypothetical protein
MKLARDKFLPFWHRGSKPHRGLDPPFYETETWEQIPFLGVHCCHRWHQPRNPVVSIAWQ